jgi:enoyl-CoA hydratase
MVDYTADSRVAVITINRPQARNAVNPEVAHGIENALDRFESDPDVWVAILTGAPPMFCAGADLKTIAAGQADLLSTERGGFAGLVARERTKPLIAAVDGPALGGGAELVLACDLVVASRSAQFGFPEVSWSLVAAAGGLFRLGRKLPINVAMECILTGDPIEADRAHAHGLVNILCEPGEALAAARLLADRISANAPVAVRESRAVVLAGTPADDATAWALSRRAWETVRSSEDFREGPRAFVEKRPPRWTGH